MITQLINNGRRALSGTALTAQRQELLFLLWAIGLFAAPVYFLVGIDTSLPIGRHIDVRAHTVVESFCGIVALLIAGLIFTLAWQRHEWTLAVFGLGFLSMGGLDLLHAFVHPFDFPERFVMFHTLSVLSGGAILCAGILLYYRRYAPQPSASLWSKELLLLLGIMVTAAVLHSFYLPHRPETDIYQFQRLAHRTHDVASALYAFAALAFFLHFRMQGHTLSLVIAGMLLLFAESAFLFRFSQLWDSAWWLWHAVKIAFYFGTLVVIVAGLVIVLRIVEASRRMVADTNRELRKAHAALERANYELQIRNRMANDAIRSAGLNATLQTVECALGKLLGVTHYELILKVAADEADEYQQLIDRERFNWNIVVSASVPPHARVSGTGAAQDSDVMYHCIMPNGQRGACICFRLQANGAEFGYLRLFLESDAELDLNQEQLLALSAEVGSILYNAFLNHHWTDATRFRAALLRVASLMGSTLELERVLETVCKESAQLLDSDGAFVWLAEGPDRRLTIASKCVLGGANNAAAAQYAQSMGEALGRRLLACAGDGLEPVAILRDNGLSTEEADITPQGCEWGALAIFPLTDRAQLNGVMVLLRKHKVRYSGATLEKGELLARQARLAINNAYAYEQLQKVNAQLREAEEQKLRAERLAALGQMAATVAHEVGNPLSAIANCLAVVKKDTSCQPNTATAVEIMDEEIQRLQRLTRNFLNFGHPRKAAKKLVRPDEIVHSVYLAVQRHMIQEGLPVRLEQRLRGVAQSVQLDGDGFREVVWNLLLNAVQAIDGPGSVTVEVRVRRRHLFLTVADTGRGIPRAECNNIFDPFYTTRSCGAGLGLAVVRQFVEMWRGRLRVWSAPGCGTRFHLLLPIEQGLTVET